MFADLAGYTALTEAHGDDQAADLAADFCEAVSALLPGRDAEAIKTIGDAVMLRVSGADEAIDLGLEICSGIGDRHQFPSVRVGMHTGPAIERDGDWFGSTVNLAARIAGLAGGGEVLLSEVTRTGSSSGVFEFERIGARQVKNVSDPITVFRALRSTGVDRAGLVIDPVCRMAVDRDRAAATMRLADRQHFFCSLACARAFGESPERYAAAADAGADLPVDPRSTRRSGDADLGRFLLTAAATALLVAVGQRIYLRRRGARVR